ncbi:MAG: hypothetical protein GF341_06830 [candidate division Zixibacteria bacterium]|nr:hypothetical protein [candidate division Zixibacteria bacterium]
MRTSGIMFAVLLLCLFTPAFAQSVSTWMTETSPTARVWGMGHAGGASTSSMPALYSPGTLGLWAFNGMHVSYTHNSRSLRHALSSDPGFSNDIQALALNMPLDYTLSLPRLSFGVIRRTGRAVDYGGALRHYDDWTLGFGADLGIEIGVGWSYKKVSTATWFYGSWYRTFGFAARFRLNHALRRFGTSGDLLQFGAYVIEPSVSFAANEYLHEESWAFRLGLERYGLPLADVEYVSDDPQSGPRWECSISDRHRYGWEIMAFGSVAYRWGARNQYSPGGFNCDPLADWSTEGWMVDITNAQRWIRHVADLEVAPTVAWILDHVHARYEHASYRRPETVPSEVGEAAVHEWTLGLTNVTW